MDKIDFKKRDKPLYTGKAGRFDRVDVPQMLFLSIDGAGDPNTSKNYAMSVAALYGLSYGLKFLGKTAHQVDHVVGPLEGLWWADDMAVFTTRDKDSWKWRMMIRQPAWVTDTDLADVRAGVNVKNAKKKDAPTDKDHIDRVELPRFGEGRCIQVLHVGRYEDEGPILADMHQRFIPENGLKMRGLHHEIYLSDPRRIVADKLKTILRQPVENI